MNAETVIARIDQLLVREFEVDPDDVVPGATLMGDLDLDSLDGMDMVVLIEKEFELRLDEQVVRGLRTVGDVHDYVRVVWAESQKAG